MPVDPDRRYYYRSEYDLTEEDQEIIRERGIPTVDQERQLLLERPDHPANLRRATDERQWWRMTRLKRKGPITR